MFGTAHCDRAGRSDDRERQLRFCRFTPFVESVRWNQAAPFLESLPIRGRFIDCLSSRIDGPVSDLWILRPIWNQSPLNRIVRTFCRSDHNLAGTARLWFQTVLAKLCFRELGWLKCRVKHRLFGKSYGKTTPLFGNLILWCWEADVRAADTLFRNVHRKIGLGEGKTVAIDRFR